MNVQKGDTIIVLSGKDKGKKGTILKSIPDKEKVIVEQVNVVKRHTKPSVKYPQGGIIEKEMPIRVCKVMLVCPSCGKPTRVGHKLVAGKNARACKKCGEIIPSNYKKES